jgi:hypothetical protein
MSSQQWLIDEIAHYIVHSDRLFRAKLDKTTQDLERQHRAALEDAQHQHAAILAGAKDALDDARRLHAEEVERIRRRNLEAEARESEERAAREEYERRLAEANARIRAETERLHVQRRQRDEEVKKAEEEAKVRAQEAQEAQEAEAERLKNEAEQRAKQSAEAAPPPAQAQPVQPVDAAADAGSPLVRWDRLEQEHNEYLQLHQKLKDMRKHMVSLYKQANASKGRDGVGNPPIQDMANWRRSLVKLLGQLTSEAAKNRQTASHPLICNIKLTRAAHQNPRHNATGLEQHGRRPRRARIHHPPRAALPGRGQRASVGHLYLPSQHAPEECALADADVGDHHDVQRHRPYRRRALLDRLALRVSMPREFVCGRLPRQVPRYDARALRRPRIGDDGRRARAPALAAHAARR